MYWETTDKKLFEGFDLPDDTRALENIEWLEELYELSGYLPVHSDIYIRPKVNNTQKKLLILLCEQRPEYIEMLRKDDVLFFGVLDFLEWATKNNIVDIS